MIDMVKISKKDLMELASKCNDCIVSKIDDENYHLGVFHCNNIYLTEEDELLTLPNEVECVYKVMGEKEYNNNVLADSNELADFEKWYGDADATILMIGIK